VRHFQLPNLPQLPRPAALRRPTHLADLAVLLGTFLLIYGLGKVGSGFFVAFKPPHITPEISLNVRYLPYYTARSTLRMFIALGLSLAFTLVYGYAAAKSHKAERILVPLLDILQSVPVLGFLSITVTGFIALFPGSLFGLECASIFAIFTAQAWNMTFSFYHSLITMPKELDEAARVFGLSKWRRFVSVEVPTAMIGLVWNGMMSFGGGWFFLAASEAISVLNKSYTLPGIGSYVAKAVSDKNVPALIYAVVAMVIVIVLIDQLFWKPVVAWSQKFRLERSASGVQVESWVLDLFRASRIPRLISRRFRRWQASRYRPYVPRPPRVSWLNRQRWWRRRTWRINDDLIFGIVIGLVCATSLYDGYRFVTREVAPHELLTAFGLGLLTLLRVMVLIAFATVVWTPIGVAIGFNPRLARTMQPLAQLAASFPANFLFPAATVVFLKIGLSLDWGSMLLMALGSQWYVLFNAIAGAMAVPSDLREMCTNMGLRGWPLWKKLIIPAIFPAWVTGAITASGGAWNASIVSEVVSWGDRTLTAHGLGSYIAAATGKGDWPRIVLGVFAMCVFVVTMNRLVWRRLYGLAEDRYRLG
jgi:NitT/TauT family transport system permease protein